MIVVAKQHNIFSKLQTFSTGGTSYQSDELTNIDFDECFGNKCQNGATCESRGGFGFDCICPPGFTGMQPHIKDIEGLGFTVICSKL